MKHVSFGALQTTSKASFLVWIKKARQTVPKRIATGQDPHEGRQLGTMLRLQHSPTQCFVELQQAWEACEESTVDFCDLWLT